MKNILNNFKNWLNNFFKSQTSKEDKEIKQSTKWPDFVRGIYYLLRILMLIFFPSSE